MFSLDIDWKGLILPFAYILVLGGTFATFSTVYRKRKAAQSANLSPWFPPHLQRNIYLSLLHMEPEPGSEKPPKVPETVLRAALLRRAVEDIHRIIQIRTGKQACASLLQRGSVGDDLWQRFSRAEKEMEDELRDVVMEANALVPNWGQIIFQTANAIAGNEALKKKLDALQDEVEGEKAWWAKRRASIERGLLSEVEAESGGKTTKKPATATTASTTTTTTTTTPTAASSTKSIESDTVLVDAPAPANGTPAAKAAQAAAGAAAPPTPVASTPNEKKKKKNKK
ncbi:translocation protein [Niveomyces insectorum RCEF 264]|uniref:Translocation protein n=1 Tax=Niveomyces insectorum RCEF 264 TaxID=1081102 RepID=A0A167WEE2_9HYPO|nr:translocation protein [Niveomyces insectorum RCEF 264]